MDVIDEYAHTLSNGKEYAILRIKNIAGRDYYLAATTANPVEFTVLESREDKDCNVYAEYAGENYQQIFDELLGADKSKVETALKGGIALPPLELLS